MGLKMLLVLMVAMLAVNGLALSYFANGSLFTTDDNAKAVEQSGYFGQNQDILTLEQNDEASNGDSAVSGSSDNNDEQTSNNDEDSSSGGGSSSSSDSDNQEIPETDSGNNEDTATDNTEDTPEDEPTSDEPGAFEETEVRI